MKRFGRRRGAVLVLLFVAGVCLALFGCARWYLTSRHASDRVVAGLQDLLGVPVQVGAVDIGVKDGSSVRDLRVFERDGHNPGRPWLTVDGAAADVTAVDVVGGSSSPRRIVLSGAAVTLDFDADGQLLTRLPRVKPSGQPTPQLVFTNARITLAQQGRPPMVVEGINAETSDDGGGLEIQGTARNDYWGDWTLAGAFKVEDGDIRLRLKTAKAVVTQQKLDDLPFVSPSVWEQVKVSGTTPVDLTLQFSLGTSGVHYRVELEPEDTNVHVTSIDLKADRARGKVVIENRLVQLRDVTGRTANGAIELRHADLDFRKKPTAMTFDVGVKKVELQKLPASWGIEVPPFFLKPLLTGTAKLAVTVADGKAHTTGDGDGVIETVVLLKPAKIRIQLLADAGGFHFSKPQPPPRDAPKPAKLRAASGGAPGDGIVRVNHRPEPPPGQQTSYVEATLDLKDVDLAEAFRELKWQPPFTLSGKVSLRVQLAVPLDTPRDFRAYQLRGRAEAARLDVSGLEMTQVSARVRYEDGVLRLEELRGRFPDSGGAFDGDGRLRLIPEGDLEVKLQVRRVPLTRLLALLPGAEGGAEGVLSGGLSARAPASRLRDPAAWSASGELRSERVTAYGLTLKNAAVALSLREGVAGARALDAGLEGGRVSGQVAVRLTQDCPYKGRVELRDVDLSAVTRLSPSLRPSLAVAGRGDAVADFEGGLSPFSFAASGSAVARDLRLEKVKLDELAFNWVGRPDHLLLRDVKAKLYQGEARGTATVPLRDAVAGDADVTFDALDAQALARAAPLVPVTLDGRVSGTVGGTLGAADAGGKRELATRVELSAPRLRVEGVPAEKVHGVVAYRGGAAEYRVEAEALGGTFALNGTLPPPDAPEPDKPGPQGRLLVRGVRLRRLVKAFNRQDTLGSLRGTVELDLPFRHEGPGRLPVGDGRLRVADVRWGAAELTNRIQGELRLTAQELQLRDLTGNLGEGELRARAAVNFREGDRSWFHLQIARVEAARLLGPLLEPNPASAAAQPVGANPSPVQGPVEVELRGQFGGAWRGTGNVVLTRGKLLGVEVSEWRLPLAFAFDPRLGGGQLDVRDGSAQFAQGRATGEATLRWGAGTRLDGTVRFYDADVRSLLRPAGEVGRLAAGRVTGRLDFGGESVRSADDLRATLDASFSQAQALQLPVLDVVAPYLAPGQSGMAFPKGDVHATLSRGVVRVQRFALSNATLQMLVEGTVTLQGLLNLDVTATTGTAGLTAALRRLADTRLPASGIIPAALLAEATTALSSRLVHYRVTGTVRDPHVRAESLTLLTEEAVRYFLGRASLPVAP